MTRTARFFSPLLAFALLGSACAANGTPSSSTSASPVASGSAATAAPIAQAPVAQSTGGAGQASAPAASGPQAIDMTAAEYVFAPDTLTVHPGEVTITLTNNGPLRQHAFNLKDADGNILVSSDAADPGTTTTFSFTVTQPGTYTYYCPIDSHADRGEVGTLTVSST